MSQVSPSHIADTQDRTDFASPEELARQSAYFIDAFMTSSLLNAIPNMVLVLNSHNQIIFANRAFYQLTGRLETEGLVGHLFGDVLSCHVALDSETGCGDGSACVTCGALKAILEGSSGTENVQECIMSRQEGTVTQNLTLRVWSAPLLYEGETFTVLAGMDISHERRRLALEKTFFHDILNLVGSIRGFAELMEIDKNVNPMDVSRRIQQASQRIVDEIDAQRVLLAVEKGELNVESQVLVSSEILGEVLEIYEGQEVARQRQLRIDDDSDVLSFVSDATLLRRILGNMVKNALEASPEGDIVTLGAYGSEKELNFWVHNTAIIPSQYQQRIFQRDFSTKGSGRGLGTYSMQLLGRFLSGEVSFVSASGIGTRFTLRLPVLPPEKTRG